jgi:hypothetical protein
LDFEVAVVKDCGIVALVFLGYFGAEIEEGVFEAEGPD